MKSILLIFLALFIAGCFVGRSSGNDLLIDARILKVDSWVNLMPGSKETIHINGIIRLRNDNGYNIDSISAVMRIIQNENEVYMLNPHFEPSSDSSLSLKKSEEKEFTFVSEVVPQDDNRLIYNQPFTIELLFSSGDKTRSIISDSLNIEKAY